MAQVSIKGLTKTFADGAGRFAPVMEDLSLSAADGEFVSLLGPSGCGKTTILNVLAGLTKCDRGEILVDGSHAFARRDFGYVFQQPRLLNWSTVKENLLFVLKDRSLSPGEMNGRVNGYLNLVGLSHVANDFPLSLSGGMQQRVGIARALTIEPKVLLMDEPFCSLDELTAREMRNQLVRIWRETQKTVFFVTHNPYEAVAMSSRIYLLSRRPCRVLHDIEIDIAYPRNPDDTAVARLTRSIIDIITGQ